MVLDTVATTEVDNQAVQVEEAHHTFLTMVMLVIMVTMGGEAHHSILEETLHHRHPTMGGEVHRSTLEETLHRHHPILLQTLAMHHPLHPGRSLE